MMVNPMIWYSEREINIVPPHFFKCPSPVTPESLFWVHNKSNSRYVLVDSPQQSDNVISNDKLVYFESQKDATMYELLWSGSK
jgi:hypothetical protein